jgi:elongator complex protein 3
MNHSPEKVEIILQGGTFPFSPKSYQEYFISCVFKAMNDFSKIFYPNGELDYERFTSFFELPIVHDMDLRIDGIHKKCLYLKSLDLNVKEEYERAIESLFGKNVQEMLNSGNKILQEFETIEKMEEGHDHNVRAMKRTLAKVNAFSSKQLSLEEVQKENEISKIRCVGLTIETKSDYGKLPHGNEMLRLGCTRVEIGIQTIYDEVLLKTHRGNTVADNVESIRILKDLGFKINAHIMPGLPYTTEEMDKIMLKTIFGSEDYRPDMLKIYPCMVMEGTKLFEEFKKGLFTPLSTAQAAERIAWFKQFVPEYCRIMRVQRDIPTFMTEGGVDKTNLRQYIEAELKKQGIVCRCIRCREPGHQKKKLKPVAQTHLRVAQYRASEGEEFFITFEDKDNDLLLGYCRLRFPSECLREEITPTSALLRELHVFGKAIPLGEKDDEGIQHKGIGKMLLQKAEDICTQQGKNKLVVISGVGAREYYRKIGYSREGPYMVKAI